MNFLKKIFKRFNRSSIEEISITTQASESNSIDDQNYKLLKRVPEQFHTQDTQDRKFHFAIIDFDTLGLDPNVDPIIEIGILKGAFTTTDGIVQVIDTYQNDIEDSRAQMPHNNNPTEMMIKTFTQKAINWDKIYELIQDCDLIICHNSKLKRSFLEKQTPESIQEKCKDLPFGCLLKDIDWTKKKLEVNTLKLLNYELGYFYDSNKILTRCWATLNSLIQVNGAFDELKNNIKKRTIILCLDPKQLDRNHLLQLRKYTYSDGSKRFPKCWWISIAEEDLGKEITFLENVVFQRKDIATTLSCYVIPSKMKHSSRFKETALYPQFIENQWVLCEESYAQI